MWANWLSRNIQALLTRSEVFSFKILEYRDDLQKLTC